MLPHDKVFTRLGQSKIHGIGVFAIVDIEKNTHLFEFDNTEFVWVKRGEIENVSEKIKKLYEDFCPTRNNGNLLGCPANFNQLTMAWYINHSDDPNVEPDSDYNFTAIKRISDGEELTIDYNAFDKY
jgi:SET domain-containing protein